VRQSELASATDRRELQQLEMLSFPAICCTESIPHHMTRRIDFALFMVAAIENDALFHEATAIVSCQTPSALAHTAIGIG
jgi:hypothetical protein